MLDCDKLFGKWGTGIMDTEKTFLTVFIDESGSITKTDVEHHKYFIIALLFTRNSGRIKRYFQKGIASLMQNPKYKTIMTQNWGNQRIRSQ